MEPGPKCMGGLDGARAAVHGWVGWSQGRSAWVGWLDPGPQRASSILEASFKCDRIRRWVRVPHAPIGKHTGGGSCLVAPSRPVRAVKLFVSQ